MDIKGFREYLISEMITTAKNESLHKEQVFINYVSDILINDYDSINGMDYECYVAPVVGTKAFRGMELDAGYLDLSTNTLNLLISDYSETEMETLKSEFVNMKAQKMQAFFENILKGYYSRSAEESQSVVQFARDIVSNQSEIYKLKLFLISTNILSERIKTLDLPAFKFQDRIYKVEYDVIDIEKIFNAKSLDFVKEDIVISTKDFGVDGIPCIKADIEATDYESYLAIVSGNFLADIYKKYGARLLEDNVRSFLNVRGGVNKGIRGTILNAKDKFFTYNNGISTTAKELEVGQIEGKGLCITSFVDLQIINGGQTTASLASASIKDKADLSGIYVQMKLTKCKNNDQEFVRKISKFANSQNKVTNADLNSNHAFYKRIEEFSNGKRRIMAPAVNGNTYQTVWFFERARGQYEQPKMKMTNAERASYDRVNPKSQKFTKTDIAKYINSADMLPHNVAWGADVNASKFQTAMEKLWEKDDKLFNETYYKDLIGKAIMFKQIESTISEQDWYKENKGYRAQLVTYTFAKFVERVKSCGKYVNYKTVWDKQSVPEEYKVDITNIAKLVYDAIYDPNRTHANVGEYCKREVCWKAIKEINYQLSDKTLEKSLTSTDIKTIERQGKKEQAFDNSINSEMQIFNKGFAHWERLLTMGIEQKVLHPKDEQAIKLAIEYCKYTKVTSITPRQATAIITAETQLKECGIE